MLYIRVYDRDISYTEQPYIAIQFWKYISIDKLNVIPVINCINITKTLELIFRFKIDLYLEILPCFV